LLLAEKGDIPESRKFFLRSLELMPERTRILYNLGLLENSQGNLPLAEEYFLKALKREPDNYDYLYAACTFYLEHGLNLKALPLAKHLVEKYPQNPAGKQLLNAASR
jgi:tetratricopeptide (TPR) repeat protein